MLKQKIKKRGGRIRGGAEVVGVTQKGDRSDLGFWINLLEEQREKEKVKRERSVH